jgi:hypothetical protein
LKVSAALEIVGFNFDALVTFGDGFNESKRIAVGLDSHVTRVYANQQWDGLGYKPKSNARKRYHPLLCFIGETMEYIVGLFRSGKHHTSYQ